MSDQEGIAANVDPDMINAWGFATDDANKAFWIADNETGKMSIVDDTGAPVALRTSTRNQDGTLIKIDVGDGVTGVAKNPSSSAFLMHAQAGCAAAKMLVSNEGGQIIAINDDIDAARGMVVVDRSADGASYKGLAIISITSAPDPAGNTTTMLRILAPDFHNARVDVFDENFQLVNAPALPSTGSGSGSGSTESTMFVNAAVPAGYAPFNVVGIKDKVYVTYAVQDADKADDVRGAGLGMVDEFDLEGNFIRTLVAAGQLLNAPWGIALAPSNFCKSTAGALLIGNFGDGHITAVDVESGRLIGQLANDKGGVLAIDGLWALNFGTDTVGKSSQLYFSAGPDDETHGLFGYLMSQE